MNKRPHAKGRGSQLAPANRFGVVQPSLDLEHVAHDEAYLESLRTTPTEYLRDQSQSVISENNSPDIGFRYSLNPYRGCAHGCAYWYEPPKPVAPLYFPAFFEFGGRTRELTFARSTR